MHKTPIDLRIVVYITYAIGFFTLAMSALLLTPVAHLGENGWHILFGTITLSTKFSCAMYMFLFGFVRLLCAYGLMRLYKLAWWIMLLLNLYEPPSFYFSYTKNQINALAIISIFINVTIIIWLLLRKKLFVKKQIIKSALINDL